MSELEDTAELELPARALAPAHRLPAGDTRVDVAGLSHPGRVRPNNEDHFLIARFGRFLETVQTNLPAGETPEPIDEIGCGIVVADGMGGHAAGEVASRLAIQTFVDLVRTTPDWIFRFDPEFEREVIRRARERGAAVGAALAERARTEPALEGFGTTMTFASSLGRDLFVGSVGDSRAYLLRRGELRAITHDHTVAQELADQGLIEQRQVQSHHLRHVLTRALGAHGGAVEPDVQALTIEDGDCLLLCTDGLTDMVDEQTIAKILGDARSAEQACRRLVDRALAGGGRDNVTAVVALFGFGSGE